LVTDQLYRAGATGTVLDADKWSIADSPHRVVGVAVPLRLYCCDKPAKRKAFYKWRTDILTGKGESSEEVQAKYQRNLKQSQARIQRMASQAPHVGQLLAAIVRAFVAAGKDSIGMKRIVPGRTKSWWNEDIDTAIATRRELHKTMRDLGTQQSRDAYQSQRKLVKQLVCKAQQQHQIDRENAINSTRTR
jgi:hypothetical protein